MAAPATLVDLVGMLSEDDELFGPDGACPTQVEPGANPRVLLVTGGNAGGKSLVCRYLDAMARDKENGDVEFMRVGMGMRTTGGIKRGIMFGDEGIESTGLISGNVVKTGFGTARKRSTPHFLCFDEPDIGLSEEMQAGMGQALSDFAGDMPELTLGLVVVTHSRAIANALLVRDPWCVRAGDDLRPTREWAASVPVPASAEEFLGLQDVGRTRWRAVQAVLNARQEERRAQGGPRR